MFNKIFKPRWQHRKAEVRIAALNELTPNDPVLLQVAGSDADPAVRRHALRRISDVPSLARLLNDERDEAVRASGDKRLKRLLAGEEADSPELALRRQLLLDLEDEDILAYVLRHAEEAALRRSALEAVSRPAILAEVALSDPNGELRLAALERIERPATLERVVKQAKGRDKRVARRARERLEAMRTEAERPGRQAAICEAIEGLVEHGGVDLIAFDRLQKEWQGLLPATDAGLAQRFAAGCEAFSAAQARLQAEAALTARQRELCERIEELQQEVEQSEADLIGMDSAITLLQRAWQGLEEESAALSPALAERFFSALARTEKRRAERLVLRQESAHLQGVLDELTALLDESSLYDEAALERIVARWREAGGERTQSHTATLQSRFERLLQQARQRLAEQGHERDALQEVLDELLAGMETALDEGQLQQAASCHDKARARVERLRLLGGKPSGTQHKRLHKAAARLRELRDWRRFGTDRARGELLEQMSALPQSDLPPPKLAEAVKALRNEWRRLDRKDGPAAEALWQAFDQAAETAYAPCRAHYEALQQERRHHLEGRERFLEELEQAFEVIDWQAPEWGAIEQRLQQAKKAWPKLGGVEHREWQALNGRFRRIIERFEQQLGPQREREQQRREGLIATVERLAEEPDLEKALAEAKAAQAAWRPELSASPRVEQRLWRRFKKACDAVYARQRAATQARREAAQADHARLEQLCGELEALTTALDGDGLSHARSRLAELRAQWEAVNRGASSRHKELAQRFDAANRAFRRAEAATERQQAEAQRQRLQQKAALCEALEARLFDTTAVSENEELEHSWRALPALQDSALEQSLSRRFDRVQAALKAGGEAVSGLIAEATDNLARRQAICLQLEILAGVDSPAALAEARLAMQVEMLADAMSGELTAGERQERAQSLLGEYFSIGAIPPKESEGLAVRMRALIAGLNGVE